MSHTMMDALHRLHTILLRDNANVHVGVTGVYPIGSELLYTDKDDKEHKCIVEDIEECDKDTGTHDYRVVFPDGNYRSTTSRKLKRAPAKFEVGELVIYFPKYNVQKQREERKLVEITKKAYPDQRQLKQGGEDDNDSCWVYDIRECGKDGGRQDYYGIKEMDLKKSKAEVERKKKEEAEEAKRESEHLTLDEIELMQKQFAEVKKQLDRSDAGIPMMIYDQDENRSMPVFNGECFEIEKVLAILNKEELEQAEEEGVFQSILETNEESLNDMIDDLKKKVPEEHHGELQEHFDLEKKKMSYAFKKMMPYLVVIMICKPNDGKKIKHLSLLYNNEIGYVFETGRDRFVHINYKLPSDIKKK